MTDIKRIMISLPGSLLEEVDDIISLEKKNRSEFVREAMRFFIEERNRRLLKEKMRRGYMEMAKINLALAMEGFAAEGDVDFYFEGHYMECNGS